MRHGSNRFQNAPALRRAPLAEGAELTLPPQQTNYLVNVMRLGAEDRVLLFNGRDGEFMAALTASSRKGALLSVGARTRPQETPPDVDYLFAPLKHARLDYMAQKAIEMGARRLRPVLTRRTQVARVNLERLGANAIEACEQCGIYLDARDRASRDAGQGASRLASGAAARLLRRGGGRARPLEGLARESAEGGVGLLIGPEGGFADDERAAILKTPRVLRLSLGPRILRADTAAVAALALIQATLGDWPK